MMKSEFEKLAIRNNEEISYPLFETIERFYMSDNEYHKTDSIENHNRQQQTR